MEGILSIFNKKIYHTGIGNVRINPNNLMLTVNELITQGPGEVRSFLFLDGRFPIMLYNLPGGDLRYSSFFGKYHMTLTKYICTQNMIYIRIYIYVQWEKR